MSKKLHEEMVSGDAGGNADNIAAGKNSGAAVYPGPKTLNKKKKVKRMTEVIRFKAFVEGCHAAKKEKAEKEKQLKEQAEVVSKFSFKAFGSNSIVVEATETEVKSVDVAGKTSRDKIEVDALKEAYAELGRDGVLAYIKESTKLVWKSVAL